MYRHTYWFRLQHTSLHKFPHFGNRDLGQLTSPNCGSTSVATRLFEIEQPHAPAYTKNRCRQKAAVVTRAMLPECGFTLLKRCSESLGRYSGMHYEPVMKPRNSALSHIYLTHVTWRSPDFPLTSVASVEGRRRPTVLLNYQEDPLRIL